jgi:lysozyme family protein
MKDSYANALRLVLGYEGGKVNNPADPGGRTNKGITQRVYTAYRARKGLPNRSVYEMEDHECAEIYKTQYADAVLFDRLPAGVDLVVFDGAVNSGPVQSVKWLQAALGVAVDGHIGQATLNAATSCDNIPKLIDAVCDKRLAFMKALKTWKTFGKGWSARVAHVRVSAKALIVSETVFTKFCETGNARASLTDAKPPLPNADAVWGAGASGGVLSQVLDHVSPLAGTVPHVEYVVTGLTVVCSALALGGMAYSAYARDRAKKRAEALNLIPTPAPAETQDDSQESKEAA